MTDLELLEKFNGLSTDVATCWRTVLLFSIITLRLKKECEGGESAAGFPADIAAATSENSQMKNKLKLYDILYNFINNFIYLKHKDFIFQNCYHYG